VNVENVVSAEKFLRLCIDWDALRSTDLSLCFLTQFNRLFLQLFLRASIQMKWSVKATDCSHAWTSSHPPSKESRLQTWKRWRTWTRWNLVTMSRKTSSTASGNVRSEPSRSAAS